jgi:hypothetical protein
LLNSPPDGTLPSLERCPSGLRSTPGKCVYGKTYRGFESLSLRQFTTLELFELDFSNPPIAL